MKSIIAILSTTIMLASCQKLDFEHNSSYRNGQTVRNYLFDKNMETHAREYAKLINTISYEGSFYVINRTSERATEGINSTKIGGIYKGKVYDNDQLESLIIADVTLEKNPVDALGRISFGNDKTQKDYSYLLGEKVTFKLNVNNTRSGDGNDIYVPEVLNVELNGIDDSKTISKSGGLTVNWNEDSDNEDGVSVVVSWDGETNIPSDNAVNDNSTFTGWKVDNIDVVDDNGSYTLNSENFNDIPVNAFIKIQLLRGNLEEVDIQSDDLMFYGYSHFQSDTYLLTE